MTAMADDDSILNQLLTSEPTGTASRLAYWLNLARVEQHLTDTSDATRSTMLWALMATDAGVESAFAEAGIGLDAWTQTLGFTSDPTDLRRELESTHGRDTTTPTFHLDLIAAFRRHLDDHRSDQDPPTAAQLALAILDSVDTGRSKKLPSRLKELRFDRQVAVDRLEALAGTRSVRLDDFSVSVRRVIDGIGSPNDITPSGLAAALADLHPDYANGLLGTVDFGGDESLPYPLVDLLATVRHLAGELEPGEVINTRDVLIHLASFDDHVRAALDEAAAYAELLVELDGVPGPEPLRPPADRPSLDMLADVPIDDPEFDVMNFGPYVEAVVQLIENPRTTTPLSIAINGPWGSGKTSLGRMVETKLKRDQEDRLPPIITWFNAWLHDSADDLGAALTAHVGRELNSRRHPIRRFLQLLPKTMLTARQRYWRKLWVAGLGILIAVTVAYGWVRLTTDGIVDAADDGSAQSDEGDDSVAGAAAEGGAGAALVLAILAAASRFVDPARSAAAFIASPRSEAQEGALNEARKEIGSLIRHAGVPSTRSMVIFVDDLERSRPPSAIDICEVANQLLDHPGVFIIYLADMAKIASTVEIKYKDYAQWASPRHRADEAGGPDGNGAKRGKEERSDAGAAPANNGNGWWGRAYMEKMVQIQIDIPELNQTAGADLLRLITANSRAAAIRQEEERQRRGISWSAMVGPVTGAVADWYRNRRKRLLVERLYQLVDRNRDGGSLDVEGFRTDAEKVGLDPDLIGRVIQRNAGESETYRAAEAIAVHYLPNNPRAIKRLANRLRFEAEVSDELGLMFGPDSRVDPRLVGKWAVLTTRWPALTEALRSGRLDWQDLESSPQTDDLADRLRQHVRPGVAHHEIDQITALLAAEPPFGDTIDTFLYHRLAPPPRSTTDEAHQPEPVPPS